MLINNGPGWGSNPRPPEVWSLPTEPPNLSNRYNIIIVFYGNQKLSLDVTQFPNR